MQRLRGIGMTSQRTRERLIGRLREQGIRDESVLDAMLNIPRHLFVDEALASRAYEDNALPIGHHQTISQPSTVARMTELLLANGPRRRVLEIGTGSGYQAAVLCALVDDVYSVERIEPLHKLARARLQELGYRNFRLKLADGTLGWPEYAPYDGILVAAGSDSVPEELCAQLAIGGRLLIPVGEPSRHEMMMIVREPEGLRTESIGPARFVPLIRDRH
jgi:protein-L-isoaspartate(D-aspartate) O-methyltransferase